MGCLLFCAPKFYSETIFENIFYDEDVLLILRVFWSTQTTLQVVGVFDEEVVSLLQLLYFSEIAAWCLVELLIEAKFVQKLIFLKIWLDLRRMGG